MFEPRPQRSRRASRLWVVPPGLMTHEEPFEGYRVLDEVRTGAGVTLWEFIRDIDLWSTTESDGRARLFSKGSARRRRERIAELEAALQLRTPLEAVGRAMEGRVREPGALMSQACHALANWAEERGLPQTALAFAQSAALAAPEEASPAYFVGLLARRNAEYRRAETWFRRTLALARRAGDWTHYGRACLGLGNLNRQRGDYPTARWWYVKALRVARRRALLDVRAMALHDLFCVAVTGERNTEAEAWARRAFRAYRRGHPRVVALTQDVARFYLNRGFYTEARQLFRAVLPHVPRCVEQRVVTANLARAASGLGDRLTFAAMWSETWRLIDDYEDQENVAEALVTLAEGAAALGDPDRAKIAATYALKVAVQRSEAQQRLNAETLLDSLRTVPVGVVARPQPAPEEEDALDLDAMLRPQFAEHLVMALATEYVAELAD